MNLLDPVSKIMTTKLYTLSPTADIAEVADLFSTHKIHHIPIVKGDVLVGMVSKSDYLSFSHGYLETDEEKAAELKRLSTFEVETIMTTGLGKLEPTDRINVALEIFKKNIFHAIPVIEGDKLVGMVTTYDIILHLDADNEAHADYGK